MTPPRAAELGAAIIANGWFIEGCLGMDNPLLDFTALPHACRCPSRYISPGGGGPGAGEMPARRWPPSPTSTPAESWDALMAPLADAAAPRKISGCGTRCRTTLNAVVSAGAARSPITTIWPNYPSLHTGLGQTSAIRQGQAAAAPAIRELDAALIGHRAPAARLPPVGRRIAEPKKARFCRIPGRGCPGVGL